MNAYLDLERQQSYNENQTALDQLALQKAQIELENLKTKQSQMSLPTQATDLDVANTNYYNSLADLNALKVIQLQSQLDADARAAAVSVGNPAVIYTPAMAEYDAKRFGLPVNPGPENMINLPISTMKDLKRAIEVYS